ncbi:Protein-N(5)-glutamine methyltransferase PrmC, methylates polypeptide chain release factors RF1 and RF2 [plant metagenome]|uniref:peptide chain release factor N(5)-glutamine methyltransferase n=1 Tax=plant metagenome TaxID=1297885 RepID=A0A484R028_9ZZZZ
MGGAATTVRGLMADCGLPRLEARMLLERVLDKPRAWLLAHDTDPLAPAAVAAFQALCARRLAGEPMAYLLGEREFMGHVYAVAPGVLIPRPETELLVETALECLSGRQAPRVLDLGTGSGAIAVAIALARPDAHVTATDASPEALAQAHANAQRLGAPRVRCLAGDWYAALPGGDAPFDLIVSNPPYIAAGDVHLDQGDLRHEPRGALTDEADGLSALARIVSGARAWMAPGARLWLEHGWDQAAAVRQLLADAGFRNPASRRDLAGIERISGANL